MAKKAIIALDFTRLFASLILAGGLAFAAFATLGEGNRKASNKPASKTFMSSRTANTGQFNLRSGYQYRGNQVINPSSDRKYVNLNTVITLQKGNTHYTVPLKKKVLAHVKIDLGNRSLRQP